MTFLATASGLMIERVRSSAMEDLRAGAAPQGKGQINMEKPACGRGFSQQGCGNSTGLCGNEEGRICIRRSPGLRSNKRLIEWRRMVIAGRQFSTKDRILGAAE